MFDLTKSFEARDGHSALTFASFRNSSKSVKIILDFLLKQNYFKEENLTPNSPSESSRDEKEARDRRFKTAEYINVKIKEKEG